MGFREAPSYDLRAILELVGLGLYEITGEVEAGMDDLGCSLEEMEECVLALMPADFYKTMPAEQRLQLLQDVYHGSYAGTVVYIKLQLIGTTDRVRYPQGRFAQVISFKRK